MALMRCKECKKEVSNKADKCPNCGAPVKKAGSVVGIGCLFVILVIGGLIWVGGKASQYANTPEGRAAAAKREADAQAAATKREADRQTAQAAKAEQAATLRASAPTYDVAAVVAYYAANEIAGDQALKGKWFKVEGEVDRVGKDLLDNSYIAFKGRSDTLRSVQCFFDASHNTELSSIRPGQHVLVFGRGNGLMMNVLMDQCELVTKP